MQSNEMPEMLPGTSKGVKLYDVVFCYQKLFLEIHLSTSSYWCSIGHTILFIGNEWEEYFLLPTWETPAQSVIRRIEAWTWGQERFSGFLYLAIVKGSLL